MKDLTSSKEKAKREKNKFLNNNPELKETLETVKNSVQGLKIQLVIDSTKNEASLSSKRTLQNLLKYYFEFDQKLPQRYIGDEIFKSEGACVFKEFIRIATNNGENYPMEGNKFDCYKLLLNICRNYSDCSRELAKEFGQVGLLNQLLEDLEKLKAIFKLNENLSSIVLLIMGIIYNCALRSNNTVYFKQNEAVKTISWYAKNTGDMSEEFRELKTISLVTLANIVDKQHGGDIFAIKEVIDNVLRLLKDALTSSNREFKGFSVLELTKVVTKLANNHQNSKLLVKKGVLTSLLDVLTQGLDDEKIAAAKSIWVLALTNTNKEAVYANKQIVKLLEKYSKDNSVPKKLSKRASSTMWVLNMCKNASKDAKEIASIETAQSANEKPKKGHVMLSYQWDSQKLIIRIKKELEKAGYGVWFDLDDMAGSTLGAMASAVEGSDVILVCMSQKYKNSASCRTEAEYAFTLKKDIIPLKVEPHYMPDGWLGAMIGSKLYFDFSDNNMSPLFSSLEKEIGERGKLDEVSRLARPQRPVEHEKKVEEWNKDDIVKWAEKYHLKLPNSIELDGEILEFLQKLKKDAPHFFYEYARDNFKMNDIRSLMQFDKAIENLSV